MVHQDFIVKTGSGKNTNLDKAYRKLISEVLNTNDEEKDERWEIYNLIIREFFVIDNGRYFQEIKYRFTDGEDPNEVLLDIISRYTHEELSSLSSYLVQRLRDYIEDDFFKRFY